MTSKFTEAQVYTTCVMWLCGKTAVEIAGWLRLDVEQVRGIIKASPYARRADMSIEDRQISLDELRDVRMVDGRPIDGGLLIRSDFVAVELSPRQVR